MWLDKNANVKDAKYHKRWTANNTSLSHYKNALHKESKGVQRPLCTGIYMRFHFTLKSVQAAFDLVHNMAILSCKCGKLIPKLKAFIKTTPGLTYSDIRRHSKTSKDGLQAVLFKKKKKEKRNVWPVFLGQLSKPGLGHRLRAKPWLSLIWNISTISRALALLSGCKKCLIFANPPVWSELRQTTLKAKTSFQNVEITFSGLGYFFLK